MKYHDSHKRKFAGYTALTLRLRRKGIAYPGKTATLLFNVFVIGSGKIYKENVIAAGILRETDNFFQWKDEMAKHSVIIFDNIVYNPKDKYTDYTGCRPGYDVLDIINKEKTLRNETATKKDIDNTADRFFNIIKFMINRFDPPYTFEKLEYYKKAYESNEGKEGALPDHLTTADYLDKLYAEQEEFHQF